MPLDPGRPRSRRSLLAAAAGGAAGLAASRLAVPEAVAAANPPMLLNQDNPVSAMTSITGNGINAFKVATGTQATAIWAVSGSGAAIYAQTDSGVGLSASATSGTAISATSSTSFAFDGSSGTGIAVRGWSSSGTGVLGHVGGGTPVVVTGAALVGSVSAKSQVGIRASGRVQFPDRSGKVTIGAGKASVSVPVASMTSGNYAMAVLGASRTGRWVRAVACSSGKITIYLNVAVTSATPVHWLVLG